MPAEKRYKFTRAQRLRTRADFSDVHGARVRESRGPLTIYGLPNERGVARLGLSVSRAVGTAPRRNRIKRLIRESFRLMQHDFPRGYDLMIVVRPHEPLILAEYQRILSAAMVKLHATWARRMTR